MAGQKKGEKSSRSRSGKSTPSQRRAGAGEGDERSREHGGREHGGRDQGGRDQDRARNTRSDRDREAEERGQGREETGEM